MSNGGKITVAMCYTLYSLRIGLHNARSRSTSPSNFAPRYTVISLPAREKRRTMRGEKRNRRYESETLGLLRKSVFHARQGSRAEPLAVDNF